MNTATFNGAVFNGSAGALAPVRVGPAMFASTASGGFASTSEPLVAFASTAIPATASRSLPDPHASTSIVD